MAAPMQSASSAFSNFMAPAMPAMNYAPPVLQAPPPPVVAPRPAPEIWYAAKDTRGKLWKNKDYRRLRQDIASINEGYAEQDKENRKAALASEVPIIMTDSRGRRWSDGNFQKLKAFVNRKNKEYEDEDKASTFKFH